MRKDFWIVLGIVNEQASLLDIFEDRQAARQYADGASRDVSGVSVWHMASRETIGVEEQE